MENVKNKEQEKYVFISYAHRDFAEVEKIIVALRHSACNLWFDSGIEKGSQWSENIALHLLNSECVLWFVSQASIDSRYVMGEINFAISHDKQVIPVFIENVQMPLGVELLLGQIQSLSLYNFDQLSQKRKELISALPKSVFYQAMVPFFVSGENVFFLNDTSKEFPDGTYFEGETDYSYNIGFSSTGEAQEQTRLFGWHTAGGYDMLTTVTSVLPVRDKYLGEIEDKVVVLNISLSFSAKYPVPWPDIDAALSLAIFDSDTENPKFKLFGAHILTIDGHKPSEDEKAYVFAKNTLDSIVKEING